MKKLRLLGLTVLAFGLLAFKDARAQTAACMWQAPGQMDWINLNAMTRVYVRNDKNRIIFQMMDATYVYFDPPSPKMMDAVVASVHARLKECNGR